MSSGLRFGEQSDARREECEYKEQQYKKHGQDTDGAFSLLQRIGIFPSPCTEKRDDKPSEEDRDIRREKVFSKDAGIGVEKDRDAQGPEHAAGKERASEGGVFLVYRGGEKERIQKDRKENELHVFPRRFIYGREQSDKRIFPCPFIEKVGQRPQDCREDKSGDEIRFYGFHTDPLLKSDVNSMSGDP